MRPPGLAAAALLVAAGVCSQAQASTLFMGAYPNSLIVFDESKGAVVQRIPLATGLPTNLRLSNDKKTIYVTTNTRSGIEVIDVATRKVTNSFSLNTPTTRYRFNGGAPDPTGRYFYTIITQLDKGIDRYAPAKTMYAVIDLQQHKIVRTAELAKEDETGGGRGNLVLSDDGKLLYLFRNKVLIVNTEDFKVVDRLDMAKPEGTNGLEEISFGGGALDSIREPGRHLSLFTAEDPYVHNRVFGVGRFDLANRQMSFTPVGPAPAATGGFQVTPDGKEAYSVVVNGSLGNKRCEFWRFDVATSTVKGKAEFSCKTRFTFGLSGNGQKLYVYGASFQIEVFDAKTFKFEKMWDLNNDITGAGMVIPD